MSIGIYRIVNKVTQKCYVGQSQNIEYRWKVHIGILSRNGYGNSKLQNAWNKYGKDNFIFEILEECEVAKLDEREIYYIQIYNSYEDGYNHTKGGSGVRGWHHSQEFKDMIALNNKTRPYSEKARQRIIQYNKTRDFHHSDETKQKMSIAHKGFKYTDEQRKKCSESQKRVWANSPERRIKASEAMSAENNIIHRITPEQRVNINKKLSIANTGKKRSSDVCEKIGQIHKGTRYMTNGKNNKRVRECDFQQYLSNGYWFGRTKYWIKPTEIHERRST